MITHYANGKILLTGEYFVLNGALALALPCTLGQLLQYETIDENDNTLSWIAKDNEGRLWFEAKYTLPDFNIVKTNDESKAKVLQKILLCCAELSENRFLNRHLSHRITTKLNFPVNWGLGSSSTLIQNLASLFSINAFALNTKTFASSGYDIACATSKNPIFYKIYNDGTAAYSDAHFNPIFCNKLFFVYLNKKQSSLSAIHSFQNIQKDKKIIIERINELSTIIASCSDYNLFCDLLNEHEQIISNYLEKPTVHQQLFSDFDGTIKSLGAWGGDFVLVCGDKEYIENYMKSKGYEIIIPYRNLIL
jgi:mevalonate kinase